jgi:ketopantoate hydroxymethyltransferase
MREDLLNAARAYSADVASGDFPNADESFSD